MRRKFIAGLSVPASIACLRERSWRAVNRTGCAAGVGAIAALAAMVLLAGSTPALAQLQQPSYPANRTSDAANVDIASSLPFWRIEDVAIGPEAVGLTHSVSSMKASMRIPADSWKGGIDNSGESCHLLTVGTPTRFVFNQRGECFYLQNGVFTSYAQTGSILEFAPNNELVMTSSDGSRYLMRIEPAVGAFSPAVYRIERPDGLVIDIITQPSSDGSLRRVRTVVNSAGFRLFYRYVSDNSSDPGWGVHRSTTGYNAAVVACDPAGDCSLGAEWPTGTYVHVDDGNTVKTTITTAGGERTIFTFDRVMYPFPSPSRFNRVQTPESTYDNIIYNYCPIQPVCQMLVYRPPPEYPYYYTVTDFTISAVKDGQQYNYGMITQIPYTIRRNSVSPTGLVSEVSTTNLGSWQYIQTPNGRFGYSGTGDSVLRNYAAPDGTWTAFDYDTRGNLTGRTRHERAGFSDATIIETASYPATCTNRVMCNRQTSHTDARGLTTTFEYDPVHGGLLSRTGPAVNGVTPQTRYSYIEKSAYYLNAAGILTAGPPVWLLSSERYCRTSAPTSTGCAAADDEVIRVYEYAAPGVADNLLVRGVVEDAAGASLRTCYGYDALGNRISETTPAANLSSCP